MNYLHIACLAFIIISSLLSLIQIVLSIIGSEDEGSIAGMKSIINTMSWLSLLFVAIDYLIGEYQTTQSAVQGLSSHLLLLGAVRLGIVFLSIISLSVLLLFRKTRKLGISAVSSVFRNSIVIVIICVLLRWVVSM